MKGDLPKSIENDDSGVPTRLVTKRGQNRKSILFLKALDVNYIKVLVLFIASNRF